MSAPSPPPPSPVGSGAGEHDEEDRHRRRVLWAMPTGLYLVGSRDADEANLMTANLVVQVAIDPKLVAVALERESVTLRLVEAGGSFSLCLLRRDEREVVRRFVKPVTEVERDERGALTALSGQQVREAGPAGLPVLASAAGYLLCDVTQRVDLGSHTLCIGEVVEASGEPQDVLRMEDTRMHYGG
jgi:flavin reductase (DIM6/NTAB) family NADH-FMN oxidoreductase RutF